MFSFQQPSYNAQFSQLIYTSSEINNKLDSLMENQKSLYNLLSLMDAHICASIEKSAAIIAQAIERRNDPQMPFVDNRIKQETESVCEVMLNKQKDLKEKENKEQQTNEELRAFEEDLYRDVKSNAPSSSNSKIDAFVEVKEDNKEKEKEVEKEKEKEVEKEKEKEVEKEKEKEKEINKEKEEKIKVEELNQKPIVPNIQPNAFAPMNPNGSNSFIQVPVNGQIMLIPVQHQPEQMPINVQQNVPQVMPQFAPVPNAPIEHPKAHVALPKSEPIANKRVGIDPKAEMTADGKCPICNKEVKGIYQHITKKHHLK